MEEKIRALLFDIVTNIKIHKIDNENSVLEVDYEKYVKELMKLLES